MKLIVFLFLYTSPIYFLIFPLSIPLLPEKYQSINRIISLTAEPAPGVVFFSDDNGNSWQNKSAGLPPDIFVSDIAVSNVNLGISTKQHGIYIYDFRNDKWVITAGTPDTNKDIDALLYAGNQLFAGSQGDGTFISTDNGISWKQINSGLKNQTIRRFAEFGQQVYAGTNGGLFLWNESEQSWKHLFGDDLLQVNGIIGFDHEIYIGTNKGVFKSPTNQYRWKQIFSEHALHNISISNGNVYALAYNILLVSNDKGLTWKSDQTGIPVGKYSFQLQENNGVEFVSQWDGIYTRTKNNTWELTHIGIPENEAITEMNIFNGMLVASSSHWINY